MINIMKTLKTLKVQLFKYYNCSKSINQSRNDKLTNPLNLIPTNINVNSPFILTTLLVINILVSLYGMRDVGYFEFDHS